MIDWIDFFDIEQLEEYRQELVPITLILDAGHGWNTAGKRSQDGTLRENQFNCAVRDKIGVLCSILKSHNFDIEYYFLSPEHSDTSLDKRVQREREIYLNNKSKRLCLGLSIHADAFDKSSANGTTTFINPSSRSRLFAEIVQKNLTNTTQLRNRGVKEKAFKILRSTYSPFILVECAFMTNPVERELLKTDSFRNLNAIILINSVIEFAFNHGKTFMK